MNYDLVDLKVLLAVAEEGNLRRGAERSHLSATSVSLRLKALEESIGTPLFTRQSRGVTLTRAGKVMVEHARRCLAQLEQMHADMLPFSQGLSGHIRVFANNNAISSHLPDDLAAFFKAYPSVRISLEERLSQDIVQAILAGHAEMGVVAVESDNPELEFFPYRDDQLVLLVPLDSKLRRGPGGPPVGFSECLTEPFISLQHGAAIHTYLMNHASALGGSLDVRVQVSGYRAVARMVAAGAGIGIVPKSAIEPTDHEKLAIIELAEPWTIRKLRLCVLRRPAEENPFVRKLVDFIATRTC